MKKTILISAIGASALLADVVSARDFYWSAALGANFQQDSNNEGQTGSFTTGNGTPSIPFGTQINAGTPYGWETEFDTGWNLSAEVGYRRTANWRFSGELFYTTADVDTHFGVTVGGGNVDLLDAALLTGSADPLGASVGAVVSAGQGDVSTFGLLGNAYYDFDTNSSLRPYIGLGIGFASTDVDFKPSNVTIINDDDSGFIYQGKVGLSWDNTSNEWFAEYVYRATEDAGVNNSLFPGSLDVENQQHLVNIGVRFNL